jgi:hypothetical protein
MMDINVPRDLTIIVASVDGLTLFTCYAVCGLRIMPMSRAVADASTRRRLLKLPPD